MSVQFGRWNFEGQLLAPAYVEEVNVALAPYGSDRNQSYSKGGVQILYRAFHTTEESRSETQPHISPSGAVITWDGRLDNRADLVSELRNSMAINSTDVAIVAAAYEKWGANCLAKLIGDWALSIWNPVYRSLLLAKDTIGTRHLYYSLENEHLTWCTVLDPLVLFARKSFAICEEYMAGWLSGVFPAAHLTPYVGIHAVPPSSWVLLRPGKHGVNHIVSRYWDFDPGKTIRYGADAEYEEHFRTVFAQAVQRRLRSDRPVLADLSGGMDSSSIVCVADLVIARGQAECPRLDTISWFDDTYDHIEPDTNELHWITKVEQKRGRTGYHIDFGELKSQGASQKAFTYGFDSDRFAATPASNKRLDELLEQYATFVRSQGYRVTLCGIGGEEATGGGVPTPRMELQNLLVRARFVTLLRQLDAWAAKMKKPRLPLLWDAIRGFIAETMLDVSKDILKTPWFHPGFVRRNRRALCGYPFRVKLLGPLPSFQHHIGELNDVRRFMATWFGLHSERPCEMRCPYLDRDLLEYIYAIPTEQLVGVGRRRYLMKRSLVGIVPDELLRRKRKAFVPPESKKKDTFRGWPSMAEMGPHLVSSSLRIVNSDSFLDALDKVRRNKGVLINNPTSVLTLELWLRHLAVRGVLMDSMSTKSKRQEVFSSLESRKLQTPAPPKSSAS